MGDFCYDVGVMTEVQKLEKLLNAVSAYYKKEGRHELPWRKTRDPYHILVSELMLQQTQVARVVPKYAPFLKIFSSFRSLGEASFPKVLGEWSGLGYNRRAKYLHQAAKIVTEKYAGIMPKTAEEIEALPGVGNYTARAVMAFAYNQPVVFIETNIRTVFTHLYFSHRARVTLATKQKVSDKELLSLIEKALALAQRQGIEPRDFYAALMDYGSHLKSSGVKVNSKSSHYTKQSKFAGSPRQLRGALIRELLQGSATFPRLVKNISKTITRKNLVAELGLELEKLETEEMVFKKAQKYGIAHTVHKS